MSNSLDVTKLSTKDAYKLIIGAIVPRPIAWVSTVSSKGLTNLAPFSFFTGVCSNPPTLLFCPTNNPDGTEKDTLRNIRETKQFVVNIVSEELTSIMNETSGDYPSNVSEIDLLKIKTLPSTQIKPPRVAASPVSFECELIQVVDTGNGGLGSGHIVIGRIFQAHFAEGVVDERYHLDLNRIKPVSRLGGLFYAPVRETFELPRPKI